MSQLLPVELLEKIACVRREIEQRKRVYPRLIAQGKMSHQKAAREIETMQEILRDYERQQPSASGEHTKD
jgi:hypothetical protein